MRGGGTNQIIAWLWVYFYPTILESNILFFSTKAARCVMMRTDFFFFLVRRNICSTNYRCYQSRLFCIANLLNSFRFCYHQPLYCLKFLKGIIIDGFLCMIQGESVYFPKLFTINSFIEINVKMWSKKINNKNNNNVSYRSEMNYPTIRRLLN